MTPFPKPKVAWQDPPVEPDMPLIPILSPRPGQPVSAWITSNELRGVVTHYVGNRTRPCTGDETTCEGCLTGRPKRWKGYVAGTEPIKGRQVLVELTYEAFRSCKALHGIAPQIYGRKITLTRAGQARNAKVKAELGAEPAKGFDAQPFDVEKALLRVWFGVRADKRASAQQQFQDTMKRLTHDIGEVPLD